MRQAIGYIVLEIFYIGAFWVFPYLASGRNMKLTLKVSLVVQTLIALCGVFAILIVWSFS